MKITDQTLLAAMAYLLRDCIEALREMDSLLVGETPSQELKARILRLLDAVGGRA